MNRDGVNAICSALKGATATERERGKEGGIMFACFGTPAATHVCVKTDSSETAAMLIDAGVANKAPYFHKSWVQVSFDAVPSEFSHRIAISHAIVQKALPKRLRDAL